VTKVVAQSLFLGCSNRVTAIIRIIMDDALHIKKVVFFLWNTLGSHALRGNPYGETPCVISNYSALWLIQLKTQAFIANIKTTHIIK